MRLLCSLVVLIAMCGLVWSDCYLHNPRGCNNRLNERNRERTNNNRMFDSQNNNRGGYNVGGDGNHGEADPMKYVTGSILPIEWTNQHECGQENTHCTIILQYMCDSHIRDGSQTGTIQKSPRLSDIESPQNGLHETQRSYADCQTRERNRGLYHGDQDLEGGSAIYTRQNPNGGRSGLECPEERDYYPYWGPSEWKDIAILTDDLTRCKEMAKESRNVKARSYCRMTLKTLTTNPILNKIAHEQNRNNKVADEDLAPLTQQECEDKGDKYEWFTAPAFDIPEPECLKPPVSRDNHNGNSYTPGQQGRKKIPQTSSYQWKIPKEVSSRCVLRLRYNISIGDYPPFDTFSADDTPDDNRHICISSIPIGAEYGIDTKEEAKERGYHMENNPKIKPLKVNGIVEKGLELELAINTAQTGRIFEDRSYRFSTIARPESIPEDKPIYNVNVRGKRGNIVQVYPSVEYDFAPNDLDIKKDDYIHMQWTGANTNNQGNDGEGRAGTDRSNVINLKSKSFGSDQPDDRTGWPGNSYPQNINEGTFLNLGRGYAMDAALPASSTHTITITQKHTIRCTTDGTIDIKYASYGNLNIMCEAASSYAVMTKLCNGKKSCELNPSTSIFGEDPCPGKHKHIWVRFGCVHSNLADAAGANNAGGANNAAGANSAAPSLSNGRWEDVDGKLKQISADDGKIVGANDQRQVFIRIGVSNSNPKGSYWQHIQGSLKYLAAGDGKLGGVNKNDDIYFRMGSTASSPQGTYWKKLDGKLKQLSIGDGKIIGVNKDNRVFSRTGITPNDPTGSGWKEIGGRMKYVTVGDGKILGVAGSADLVYYRKDVSTSNPDGTKWQQMDGSLKMVEVNAGKIVGVNSQNAVYERDGISSTAPLGTSWKQIPGQLKHISIDVGRAVGIAPDGSIKLMTWSSGAASAAASSASLANALLFSLPDRQSGWLRCTNQKVLNILKVNYGVESTGCSSASAPAKVRGWCDGKTQCSLQSSVHHYGNPCPSETKSLDIRYTCTNPAGDEMESDETLTMMESDATQRMMEPEKTGAERSMELLESLETELDQIKGILLNDTMDEALGSRERRGQGQGNGQLDNSAYYVDLHPQKVTACGITHYMCTRNNNFSNRGQKARVNVEC